MRKASDSTFREKVTVSTMEELKAIAKRFEIEGQSIIVDFDRAELTIYDDYVE